VDAPYWQDDLSTVWCGDNAVIMAEMDAAGLRFDLIGPTSPPYNLGTGANRGIKRIARGDYTSSRLTKLTGGGYYGTHDDDMPLDEYVAWQRTFTHQAFGLLTEDGALAYQHKPRHWAGRELWPTDYVHPDLAPFKRQTIILDRRGGLNFNPTYYVPTYEVLLIYARPEWRLTEGGWAAKSVWLMPSPSHWHPAPFDKSLPRRLISTTAPSLVLDPYMGSGTTLIAARELGVRAHGIDIHTPFVERAVRDIQATSAGFFPAAISPSAREREAQSAQVPLFD
jgi:modification methylase